MTLDLATFYNLYTDLGTFDPDVPTLLGGLPVEPVTVGNKASGHAYGAELAAAWQPQPWLTLHSAYTFQRTKPRRTADSMDRCCWPRTVCFRSSSAAGPEKAAGRRPQGGAAVSVSAPSRR